MGENRTTSPGFIDVHTHCFTGRRQAEAVAHDLEKLRGAGFGALVVVGLINTRLDATAMWNLIPDFVDNRGAADFNEAEELLEFTRLSDRFIIPFVDTRHLWGDVPTALQGYLRRGFRGIKGIYLPDDGNDIGVRGVPETFGISLEQYRRREWEIFAFAQEHDLPLLYHMDARRYGDVMTALLDDFPRVRVTFAHLGVGRKAISAVLDCYPTVSTDIAGLLPFMRKSPVSYRDFIMSYPDRVCFGSDAMLYEPETVLDHLEMVRELKLPEEIEAKVLSGNPARFLGDALHERSEGVLGA